jgi:hypothetical protein
VVQPGQCKGFRVRQLPCLAPISNHGAVTHCAVRGPTGTMAGEFGLPHALSLPALLCDLTLVIQPRGDATHKVVPLCCDDVGQWRESPHEL